MNDEPKNQIRQLNRTQRRVIGVLMEKAFTTPEQYPLTLKAVTTGCNQKSNRSPVVSFSEGDVQTALDQLREDLLVAEVFTDGGRAPRYRHYMRHKFDFSESQFAIIAELMLRGRQQLGELRTRASRMVRIESQDALRSDLSDLKQKGFVQSNGPLERRGIEVDHTFYLPKENKSLGEAVEVDESTPTAPAALSKDVSEPATDPAPADDRLVSQLESLQVTIKEQQEIIGRLESALSDLDDRMQRIERDLGV